MRNKVQGLVKVLIFFLVVNCTQVECLQDIRSGMGAPVYINYGYRTVSYNSYVGGASSSRHLSGTAVQITSDGSVFTMALSAVCNCWDLFSDNGYSIGLGVASNYLHIDARDSFGYWVEDSSITTSEWYNYLDGYYQQCHSGSFSSAVAAGYPLLSDDSTSDGNINSVDDETVYGEEGSGGADNSGHGSDNDTDNTWWIVLLGVVGCLAIIVGLCYIFGQNYFYVCCQKRVNTGKDSKGERLLADSEAN